MRVANRVLPFPFQSIKGHFSQPLTLAMAGSRSDGRLAGLSSFQVFSISGSEFLASSITLKPPSPHPGTKANPRTSELKVSLSAYSLGTCKAPTKVRGSPQTAPVPSLPSMVRREMRAQNRGFLAACRHWQVVGSHSGEAGDELDPGPRDTVP